MKNIVLVGFMGTGKTEVSKILASRLKWQRLCVDEMIEWKAGQHISNIFEEHGEPYFRKIESEIVKASSKDKNAVIDAGGGVVIEENNIRRLKENGVIFCLHAVPDVILKRTANYSHRPLLNTENPAQTIRRIMDKRSEYYKRADYMIDTSDATPDEVADKIVEIMKDLDSRQAPLT